MKAGNVGFDLTSTFTFQGEGDDGERSILLLICARFGKFPAALGRAV
jgi:hypothetical protein